MTVMPVVEGILGTVPKENELTGDQGKYRDYSDHSIDKISKNTWKNPEDLRRLFFITHILVGVMYKIRKG